MAAPPASSNVAPWRLAMFDSVGFFAAARAEADSSGVQVAASLQSTSSSALGTFPASEGCRFLTAVASSAAAAASATVSVWPVAEQTPDCFSAGTHDAGFCVSSAQI